MAGPVQSRWRCTCWNLQGQLCRGTYSRLLLSPCLQSEVEQFYIKAGYIVAAFHQFYWLSLTSNFMDYPDFAWWAQCQPDA